MAKAFFGSKISPNMIKTPEKFLICKNVPIARTGVQKYLGEEIGLNDKPNKLVKVYRTEEEVFNPKTIASFEGKIFTDEHPYDWVTPNTFQIYAKGAVTNVRRGIGTESDLLLADIIVYSQVQIDEIEQKQKREVSCGYECEYVPYKDGYMQKNIVGNHVALVSAGRAGNRVAIKDESNKEILLNGGKNKVYKIPRRSKVSDYLKSVGLKHIAMDADPEDVLDAVEELVNEKVEEKDKEIRPVEESKEEIEEKEVSDKDVEDIRETLKEVKDSLFSLFGKKNDDEEGIEEKSKDEDEFEKEEDEDVEGMESLDKFEEEVSTDSEVDEIESVEEDPKVINERLRAENANDGCEAETAGDEEEANKVADSAIELIKVLRPIIATIPNKKQRKRVSDNLTKVLRKQVKDAKRNVKKNKTVYSDIMSNRYNMNDSSKNIDYGKEIAKKFNPHYKED